MTLQSVSITFERLPTHDLDLTFRVRCRVAAGSTDYVVSLTRWDNLWQWGRIEDGDLLKYLFSSKRPASIGDVEWRLVRDVRKEVGDEAYDKKVRRLFTLFIRDPVIHYTDINSVWNKFQEIFEVFTPIVTYTEVWKDYYRQSLQEHYDDGVQYLEMRGVLPEVELKKIFPKLFHKIISFVDVRFGRQQVRLD